jgi:signal transduction histidine kinase
LRIVSFIPTSAVYANSEQLAMRLLLLSIIVSIPLALLAWYFARLGMLRRQHESQIAESETRLRVLSRRLLTAQEDERRRLSRDLHDELGQQITAVTLDLQQAVRPSAATRPSELIARALQGSLAILDRIHELSTRVRPAMLDDLGLRDAVRDLAHDLAARSGFELRLELRLDGPDPDSQSGTAAYRIVQEALTNVVRHAQAKQVSIDMLSDDKRIKIVITDDGIGLDMAAAAAADRLGLLGMRERAELLGGQFAIQSTLGSGTRIDVELPLHAKEDDGEEKETSA